MRVPIGSDGWYFCDWSDQPDYEYTQFRGSETLALHWVNQLRGDVFAWYSLRGLLGATFPLSDEQVAREVAWRLTSGAWLARRRVVKWVARGGESRPVDAAAFPKEDRRSAPSPSQAPDAPLFPGDIDAEAIAEAQKQAAALGIPFCEECLKAQMAAAR